MEITMNEEMRLDIEKAKARELCAHHIRAHYPDYKQLNLLRSGTDADKSKMDAFITACRNWSNGENPDPAALGEIVP